MRLREYKDPNDLKALLLILKKAISSMVGNATCTHSCTQEIIMHVPLLMNTSGLGPG